LTTAIDFSQFSLQDLLALDLSKMDASDLEAFDEALEEMQARETAALARQSLLEFCLRMNPDYKVGAHHRRLAKLLEDMAFNREDRIAVSIPPRHGKSFMVSVYFPAWFLGNFPDKKVLMVSHTTDLAVDFGRKVRNLVDLPSYKAIFPTVNLSADSKSAGRWNTNAGGEYFACGVGSALAGRGADFLIVDDPFSEQDILNGNFEVFQKAYEWFTFGARTRLMPKGRVAIVHTRWHPNDLIGMMAKDMVRNTESDQYKFFEFPAIFNEGTDDEKALWPDFFDLDALHRTKASMPAYQWNAQYQQNPTSEEGAIIKREWWKLWEEEDAPEVEFIIMSLDAAAEKNNRADFTALLTWGVFSHAKLTGGKPHIILLNAINVRVEFPELKDLALREWEEWEPDAFIVEKKSAGTQLYQELRRMGIPVSEFTPHRGTGDKVARLNAVADVFRSGMVWYPAGRRWAESVVEQVAAFPASENDDMVDCTSMALTRYRNGGFIQLESDLRDEPLYRPRRGGYY
jgi:predicted phage terminase large subunit-like protein